MKIGDRIFVRGYIDEIRKDTVIVRNDGGYYGTVLSEVTGELPSAQPERLTDYSFEESCTDCPAYDTENHRCPRFNQVIRMALKDANLEACEDCISRQEAIDALDKRFDNVPMEQTAEILKLRKDLRELPSIQSKQKRGKWIYGEDEYGIDGYHCDKCGFFVPWDYTHKFINYIEDYNFCPSCGADMRGEQDGRDD